jgi:hypothetical protein
MALASFFLSRPFLLGAIVGFGLLPFAFMVEEASSTTVLEEA